MEARSLDMANHNVGLGIGLGFLGLLVLHTFPFTGFGHGGVNNIHVYQALGFLNGHVYLPLSASPATISISLSLTVVISALSLRFLRSYLCRSSRCSASSLELFLSVWH